MAILPLFIRTVFICFVIFLTMRMGKREIGKLTAFDLVISVMIAEIAAFVIEDIRKPLTDGLVPIAALLLIQVSTASYLALKSRTFRGMLKRRPGYWFQDGKPDRGVRKKQRRGLEDLMVRLRQNHIMNGADAEIAIMETSGKPAVAEKAKKHQEAPPVDLFDTVRYEVLPLPLIMDGKVQDGNLDKLGKTRFWLKNQIQAEGVKEFKDVFFCSIDHRGRLFLDKKRR